MRRVIKRSNRINYSVTGVPMAIKTGAEIDVESEPWFSPLDMILILGIFGVSAWWYRNYMKKEQAPSSRSYTIV